MRIESVSVPFARRVNIIILALLLAFPAKVSAQAVTTSLKPVLSEEKKLYGYIDTITSKLVIKHQYKEAGKFYRGLAIVKKETGYGIIDAKGKAVYPLNSPEIFQSLNPDVLIIRESKMFKYGALDHDLKQVIPFEYDKITPVEKVLVVTKYGPPNLPSSELSGVYNSSFELIVPVEIDSRIMEKVPSYISNTVGNRVGLMTTEGKIVIPFEKKFILVYKDAGIAMVLDDSRKWQAYDLEGSLVSEVSFDEYREAGAGCFLVEMNDKWGLFRRKLLTPCVYDWMKEPDYADGTFILQKERKFGVTDSTGHETVPYQFDMVSRYGNEMFLVAAGKMYGLYNRSGKVIIPCEFDSIPAQPVNGCFILKNRWGKYGCITADGAQVVPFVLDEEYVKGNYRSASAYLEKLLEISPGHPEFIYLDALGFCNRLDPGSAVEHLKGIISGYSDLRDVPKGIHYLLSKLYTDMNRIEDADDEAFLAIPSIYGHHAYMYLADKMLKQEDLWKAQHYYHYAGLYFDKEIAAAKEKSVFDEMKKRGMIKEIPSSPTGQPASATVANLPTTLMGFAKTDRMEYAGDYRFKRLFTYDEAVQGAPAGFRLPTREDWLKLIRHIADKERVSSGNEYLIIYDIGLGWSNSYIEEGVLQNRQYTFKSQDTYGLGISPLRSYSYVVGMTDYYQGFDIIRYWIVPTTHEGRSVNCIEISGDGFEFLNQTVSTACVRYIRK